MGRFVLRLLELELVVERMAFFHHSDGQLDAVESPAQQESLLVVDASIEERVVGAVADLVPA